MILFRGHIPAEEDLPRKVGGGVLTLSVIFFR